MTDSQALHIDVLSVCLSPGRSPCRTERPSPEHVMKTSTILLAALLAATAPLAFALPATPHADHATATAATPAAPKLQAAMRSLWHGHIVATRDYAMAVHAHDQAKAKTAADAVVADAKQIAD